MAVTNKNIQREKMLSLVHADLSYAVQDYEARLADQKTDMAWTKKYLAKTKRLLKKTAEQYEEITGRKPSGPGK